MSGAVAPDGSPVEVFATFPSGNAPTYIDARLERGSTVLDLGCGGGRIAHALAVRGHRVTGVDVSPEMIAALLDRHLGPDADGPGVGAVEGVVADIDGLDLGRRFDAVVLASYLVNVGDVDRRRRYLDACRRHVSDVGRVFVQRHHPAFLTETEAEESTEDAYGYRYERLAATGAMLTARMTYLHGDRQWQQEFDTMILTDDDFTRSLAGSRLELSGWLDEFQTWAEARPV